MIDLFKITIEDMFFFFREIFKDVLAVIIDLLYIALILIVMVFIIIIGIAMVVSDVIVRIYKKFNKN